MISFCFGLGPVIVNLDLAKKLGNRHIYSVFAWYLQKKEVLIDQSFLRLCPPKVHLYEVDYLK